MTKLYILKGPCKGESFELKSDETYIGRSPDNDIQIRDKSVSRNHLKLIRKEDEYFIRDLKSTNGTFVDGEKISSGIEFEIGEGIPIAVGKTEVCIGEECLEDIESVQASRDIANKHPVNGKDDILRKILDQILDLFKRTDRGVIILIDHETKAISKEISRIKGGSKETGKWYSLDVVEKVIENGKAVIISDVYLED